MSKPMLAEDAVLDKLRFPLVAQPKIDGVRALNVRGTFTGRSLKGFKNKFLTAQFSKLALEGFDGEVAAERETHPDLCRLTSSALGTIEGEPFVLWWIFDYFGNGFGDKPYVERIKEADRLVDQLRSTDERLWQHMRVIPWSIVNNLDELETLEDRYLAEGYEGVIVRDPAGTYKHGRSTVREGGLLRIKKFIDFEFVIDGVVEGEKNLNEATINELGQTERSTHQANMVPNGMVGTLKGRTIGVVKDGTKVLFEKDTPVTVSAGSMVHSDRVLYFQQPHLIVGKIGKGKFFPKGIKDKLRFPTFQSLRMAEDQ